MPKVFNECQSHLNPKSSHRLKEPHDSVPLFFFSLTLFYSPSSHCIPIIMTFSLCLKHSQTIPASELLHKLSPLSGTMFQRPSHAQPLYHFLHLRSSSTIPSSEASALITSTLWALLPITLFYFLYTIYP